MKLCLGGDMTRKIFFIIALINIFTNVIFSQTNSKDIINNEKFAYLMNKCLSLLNKPVPNEFRLLETNGYINNENILLKTENETIIVSIILLVVQEPNLESTLAIPVTLLQQEFDFKDPIVGDNNYSYTFKRNNTLAKIQYQKLNDNNFAISVGFSEREMKLF
jgi:hypothetical protein